MSATSKLLEALQAQLFLAQDIIRLSQSHEQQANEISDLKAVIRTQELRLVRLEASLEMALALASPKTTTPPPTQTPDTGAKS